VLSRSNRQDEEQPDQDDQHVGLQSGKRGGKRIREQPYSDPSAAEETRGEAVCRLVERERRSRGVPRPRWCRARGQIVDSSDPAYASAVSLSTVPTPTPRSRAIRRTPTPFFGALRSAATFLAYRVGQRLPVGRRAA
jgi:hypothetical protein